MIPQPILDFLTSMGARPFDIVFIVAAVIALRVRHNDLKEVKADRERLWEKYELVNDGLLSHAWIIRLKLGVKTLKKHRSGDVELVQPIDEIEGE